jgi:integration host factor subunit alpha|tara:strand:+ start:2507 stop:2788 length:282 start_codon:yes stop_codon:yes gene_type:complete
VNNTFKKIDIIKNISKKHGLPLSFSKKLVNDLLDILIQNIINNKVILKNIGTFKLIKKKERMGRNPKTKENFMITPRKSVSFISSRKINDILN